MSHSDNLDKEALEAARNAIRSVKQSSLCGICDRLAHQPLNCACREQAAAAIRAYLQSASGILSSAGVPDGYVLVPKEPTSDQLDRAVAFALNVSIHGNYNWSRYMADVYRLMLAASPHPSVPSTREMALEEAAKVADEYAAKMEARIKQNSAKNIYSSVPECKMDAGNSIAREIRSLIHSPSYVIGTKTETESSAITTGDRSAENDAKE